MRARLAWTMETAVRPTVLIFDDTGFLKDGKASACVAQQYTGAAGKVTNCQVGVSLHLAADHASAAVNWRLFQPEAWDPASPKADPDQVARRAACQIPDDVGHVEKWQLALDMLDETRSWGIEVPVAVADAGYGDAAAFQHGVQARGMHYVVGIVRSTVSSSATPPGSAVAPRTCSSWVGSASMAMVSPARRRPRGPGGPTWSTPSRARRARHRAGANGRPSRSRVADGPDDDP